MSRTSTKVWRQIVATVREVGRGADLPCGICRGTLGPIDYRTAAEADRQARAAGEWWLIGAYRPLGLSVDHIVPVAAGGADTLENVTGVHNVCNSSAGAKGHRRRRTPENKPAHGYWKPVDGNGENLPGRAVPGTRRGSFVFVADPGGPPPPPPPAAGAFGVANPPSVSETP